MSKDLNRKEKAREDSINLILSPVLSGDGQEKSIPEPRAGNRCPHCGKGVLNYDGLLNLTCEECGYTLAGCFS